jgi:hypothetical protein
MRTFFRFISLLIILYSTSITAVELRHHQGGDVLIFPFFNVEQGWDSLLTISTTAKFSSDRSFVHRASVFKIRIRDAINGQLVKSMTVYNRGIVNWRASLSKNANGQTILRVAEGDCLITDTNEA